MISVILNHHNEAFVKADFNNNENVLYRGLTNNYHFCN